jgi:hypothetical protein
MSYVVGLLFGWPIPRQPLRLPATSATMIKGTNVFTSRLPPQLGLQPELKGGLCQNPFRKTAIA